VGCGGARQPPAASPPAEGGTSTLGNFSEIFRKIFGNFSENFRKISEILFRLKEHARCA
jgi:hypothetical protein